MIKTFKTKQEMDSYLSDEVKSGNIYVTKDHLIVFGTNNIDGTNNKYVGEITDIDLGVPDDEIWYTTNDGKPIPSTSITTSAFNATLVSNTYENGKGILKFNAPLTSIGANGIHHDYTITSIYLPYKLETLGALSLWFITNLHEPIYFPHSLKTLGTRALQNWYNGSSVANTPDKLGIDLSYTQLEEIGDGCFYNGGFARFIKFPKTLKTVKTGSFTTFGGFGLFDLVHTVLDFSLCLQVPTVTGGTDLGFNKVKKNYTILVPENLYEEWKEAPVWSTYAERIIKG